MTFGLRIFSAWGFMTAYYANNEYFPVLMRGAIFSVTNVISRFGTFISPFMVEFLSNPMITVVFMSFLASLSIRFLKKE